VQQTIKILQLHGEFFFFFSLILDESKIIIDKQSWQANGSKGE
jgi:hypothetical protein